VRIAAHFSASRRGQAVFRLKRSDRSRSARRNESARSTSPSLSAAITARLTSTGSAAID
jgi:hypothetical protein